MHLHRLIALISIFPTLLSSTLDQECPSPPDDRNSTGITALILARGGSKGIPLKNLATINGEPLLIRSIRVLLEFGRFSSIWVSTDDDRIAAAVADSFPPGGQVWIHWRPPVRDSTPSIESTVEFIRRHPEVDGVALVQCTSPFLGAGYLEEAFGRFQGAVDCVFSVVRSYKLRWRRSDGGSRVVPVNFDPDRRPRRQDWDGEMLEAGMFYLARRELLLEGRFQNDRCQVVEIDAGDALEIDSMEDLELARMMEDLRLK